MDRKPRKMLSQILILLASAHVLNGQQPGDFVVPSSGTVNLLVNPSAEIVPTKQTDLTVSNSNTSSSTSSSDMVIAPPSQSTILDLMEKYSNVVNVSSGTTNNFPVNPPGNINILQSSPESANAPTNEVSQVNILSVPSGAAVVSSNLIASPNLSISSTQQSPSVAATEISPVTSSAKDPSSVIVHSFVEANALGQSMPIKEILSPANPTPSNGQIGVNPMLDSQPVVDSLSIPPLASMDLPPQLDLSVASLAPNDTLSTNIQSNFGFDSSAGNKLLAIGESNFPTTQQNFPSTEFSVLNSRTETQPLPSSTSVIQVAVTGQETTGEKMTSTGFGALPPMNVPVDQLINFPSSDSQQQLSSVGLSTNFGSLLTNVQPNTITGKQSSQTGVLTGNEPSNQYSNLEASPIDPQNILGHQVPFQANSGAMTTDMNQSRTQSGIDSFNVNVNQPANTLSNTPTRQTSLLSSDILTAKLQSNPGFLPSKIPASLLATSNINQPNSIPTQIADQQNVVSSTPAIDTKNSQTAQSVSNHLRQLIPAGGQGPLTDTLTSSNQQGVDSIGMNRGNILDFPTQTQQLKIPQSSELSTPTELLSKQLPSHQSLLTSQQNLPVDTMSSTITNLSTTINLTEKPVPRSLPVTSTEAQHRVQNSSQPPTRDMYNELQNGQIPASTSETQADLLGNSVGQGQQITRVYQPQNEEQNPKIIPLANEQQILQQNHANQAPNQVNPNTFQSTKTLLDKQSGGVADQSQNTEQNPEILPSVNQQQTLQQNLANQFPSKANPVILQTTQKLSGQQLSVSPENPQTVPSTSSTQNLSGEQIGASRFQTQNGGQNSQMFPSSNQPQTMQQNISKGIPSQKNPNAWQSTQSQNVGQNSQMFATFPQQLVAQNGSTGNGGNTIQNSKAPLSQGSQPSIQHMYTNQQSVYPYSIHSQQSIPNQTLGGIIQHGQQGSVQQQTPSQRSQLGVNSHLPEPLTPNTQQAFQQNFSNQLPNLPNQNLQNLPVTPPSDSSPITSSLNQGINKNIYNISNKIANSQFLQGNPANIGGATGQIGQNPMVDLRNIYQQAVSSGVRSNSNFLPNQYFTNMQSGQMQGISGYNSQQLNIAKPNYAVMQGAQNVPNIQQYPQMQTSQPMDAGNYFHNYFPSPNLHNPTGLKSNFEQQIVHKNPGIKTLTNQQRYASRGNSQRNIASPASKWFPVHPNQLNAKPKINKNKEWEKFGALQVILNSSPAHVLRKASLPSKSTEQPFKTSQAARIPLKTSQDIYRGSYTRMPGQTGITLQDFQLPDRQTHIQAAQAVQTPPQLSTQNLNNLTRPLTPSYQGMSQIQNNGLPSNNAPRDFAARLPALQIQPQQVLGTRPQMVNLQTAANITTDLKNISIPQIKPVNEIVSQQSHIVDSTVSAQGSPNLAALRRLAGNAPVIPVVPRRKALLYAQGSRGELPTGAATYRNTGSSGNNMLMNMMLMQRLEQMGEGGGPQMNVANMMKMLNPRAAAALNSQIKPTTQLPPRTLTEALGYYDPIMKEFIPKQAGYGPEFGVKRTTAKPNTIPSKPTSNYAATKRQNPTFSKAMAVIENARLKAFNQIKQQPRPFLLNQFFQWKSRSGTAAIAPKLTEFIQYLKETITKVMPLFIPSHTQQASFKRSAENQNSKDHK